MVEEDPLFPGQPLKRGRSVNNRVNWNGIDIELRQLCRIIVEREEIDPNDKLDINKFMKMVSMSNDIAKASDGATTSISGLKTIYADAYLEFRERKVSGDLPKLTIAMAEANGKKQNPFGVNRSY